MNIATLSNSEADWRRNWESVRAPWPKGSPASEVKLRAVARNAQGMQAESQTKDYRSVFMPGGQYIYVELANKDILVRYLLGDLPEQEMERLAEEYFADDEAWEALNAVESDLIDAYVRAELSQELQQKFTAHFMNSP